MHARRNVGDCYCAMYENCRNQADRREGNKCVQRLHRTITLTAESPTPERLLHRLLPRPPFRPEDFTVRERAAWFETFLAALLAAIFSGPVFEVAS